MKNEKIEILGIKISKNGLDAVLNHALEMIEKKKIFLFAQSMLL